MITLINASRRYRSDTCPAVILASASVVFRDRERIGILAASGSGKSTLARMFSGIDQPDSGSVVRHGRVSWPMGFAGAFHPELTAAANIALIADMIGQDPGRIVAFCELFGNLSGRLDRKMKVFSPAERAILGFSLSIGTPCDTYIADEVIGVGGDDMRRKCDALLDLRLKTAGLVFLSRNPAQIKKYCQTFYILLNGNLVSCRDIDVGAAALKLSSQTGSDPLPEQVPA